MSVKVKGTTTNGQEEKNVWVEKRSEFGLEIVSLVESGIRVELESTDVPKDQCIKPSEIYGAFQWLVAPTPTLP